jgi:hypothetical protein
MKGEDDEEVVNFYVGSWDGFDGCGSPCFSG